MSSGMSDRSQLVFTRNKRPLPSARLAAAVATFGVALTIYWLTAYRTITWWSSSQLALAASDLGVMAPPGAVIPTILGWVVMRIVPGARTFSR